MPAVRGAVRGHRLGRADRPAGRARPRNESGTFGGRRNGPSRRLIVRRCERPPAPTTPAWRWPAPSACSPPPRRGAGDADAAGATPVPPARSTTPSARRLRRGRPARLACAEAAHHAAPARSRSTRASGCSTWAARPGSRSTPTSPTATSTATAREEAVVHTVCAYGANGAEDTVQVWAHDGRRPGRHAGRPPERRSPAAAAAWSTGGRRRRASRSRWTHYADDDPNCCPAARPP